MLGSIITGAVIGFIASKLMHAENSFIVNVIIGMLGSVTGNFLFGLIGIYAYGFAGIIVDIIGACVVIALARKISR